MNATRSKPELASKAQYMFNVFSQKIKLGDLGDLARDVIEEHLISKLPETLIFDDIERAPIDSQVLFGLLNEFVEHQEKRIILIVHSDERKGKQEFLKRKEKLVGRTLAIEADFESSFPSFVELMNQGRGKEYFLNHADVVKTVFEEAGHQNLRLLRNAVRDCALVLDRVAEERFDAKEPTSRFVRTYLALSMALSKGEITLEDIAQRDSVDWMISGQDDQAKSPLKNLHERHSGADIFAHSGSVLPKLLAELLFEKGHAEDSELNSMLEATGQFEAQDEFPLWKRVIHFLEFDLKELETLVSDAEAYLFETSPIDPGPYLHISDSMLRIQGYGGLEIDRTELKQKIIDRINALRDDGKIPSARFGQEFGWGKRGDRHFSFGGYACDAADDFFEIMNAMTEAQISEYEKNRTNDAADLFSAFENDLDTCSQMISSSPGSAGYYRVPIFHHVNLDHFSEAILQHLKEGRASELGKTFDQIADRHRNIGTDWSEEIEWFSTLSDHLEAKLAQKTPLAKAQFNAFKRFNWNFVQPQKVDQEIS